MLLDYRERVQEREVRVTAQRLLADHLRPGARPCQPGETFWTDIDLDLTGATLVFWDMTDCRVRNAKFNATQFIIQTHFRKAQFTGLVRFNYAQFTGMALFDDARFNAVGFRGTQFTDRAEFSRAQFTGVGGFDHAQFNDDAVFNDARFIHAAWFSETRFTGRAEFSGAQFTGGTKFSGAQFEQGMPPEVAALSNPTGQDDTGDRTESTGR